jgi:hypothetical protein
VFFVPPHKLVATLEDVVAVLGEGRRCAVCREMTKARRVSSRSSSLSRFFSFSKFSRGAAPRRAPGDRTRDVSQYATARITPVTKKHH